MISIWYIAALPVNVFFSGQLAINSLGLVAKGFFLGAKYVNS